MRMKAIAKERVQDWAHAEAAMLNAGNPNAMANELIGVIQEAAEEALEYNGNVIPSEPHYFTFDELRGRVAFSFHDFDWVPADE